MKMHASAILILFIAMLSGKACCWLSTGKEQAKKLDIQDIETAPYKVVKLPGSGTRDYEKRIYPTLHWVTTDFRGSWDFKAFSRLFGYIQGQNNNATKMNMTSPVVVTWDRTKEGFIPFKKDKMSFFISQKFQKNPPKPNDPDVFLEFTPLTLYARTYEDDSTDAMFLKERMKLEFDLSNDNLLYNTSVVYYAGYNSPFQFSNRKNEVWILAADK